MRSLVGISFGVSALLGGSKIAVADVIAENPQPMITSLADFFLFAGMVVLKLLIVSLLITALGRFVYGYIKKKEQKIISKALFKQALWVLVLLVIILELASRM